MGYWLLSYWLLGYWLLSYWLLSYWLLGYWLLYFLYCILVLIYCNMKDTNESGRGPHPLDDAQKSLEHSSKVKSFGKASPYNRTIDDNRTNDWKITKSIQLELEACGDNGDFFKERCFNEINQRYSCPESCVGVYRTFSGCCNNLINKQYGQIVKVDQNS